MHSFFSPPARKGRRVFLSRYAVSYFIFALDFSRIFSLCFPDFSLLSLGFSYFCFQFLSCATRMPPVLPHRLSLLPCVFQVLRCQKRSMFATKDAPFCYHTSVCTFENISICSRSLPCTKVQQGAWCCSLSTIFYCNKGTKSSGFTSKNLEGGKIHHEKSEEDSRTGPGSGHELLSDGHRQCLYGR